MSRGGAEREEGDTESEAGSRLRAVSTEPNLGLELMDCEIMTWAEVRGSTDVATQAPGKQNQLLCSFYPYWSTQFKTMPLKFYIECNLV